MNRTRQSAGFSLVEVLCAILILGIGMAGLTHGLATALSASKESEEQTTAALLAAAQIELLRADGYVIEGTEQWEGEGDLAAYAWEQTITRTEIDGLYEVVVVVQKGNSGQTVYELRTLLFDAFSTSSAGEPARTRPESRRQERRAR